MKGFYEFASFRLDTNQCRLTRGETTISLTPKEYDVLLFLIENAGRVVEKDELLDAVWKDTFVEEGTLTRNISWLRKKLVMAEDDAKIIETLPKRGYRFLPEITKDGEEALIVEERIVRQIQIEEIIEIDAPPSINETAIAHERFTDAPPEFYSNANPKILPPASVKKRISTLWLIPAFLIPLLIIFAAYRGYFARSQPPMILASKIVPFSGLPGKESSPSFSPDGKQMVFSWDGGIENGNSDVYVKLISTGEPVRLTDTVNEEINPVFAPDGKSIAFVRIFPAHNEIISIPALGGAERKIYEHAGYASISFSPDGKLIAAADLDLSGKETGIFTIDIQTGVKTRLTMPVAPVVDHTPRFSPDGRNLAFIRYFSSFRREIFVVPATGGEPRQITFDDVRIYGLTWNADGESLFFTSFRQASQLNLWRTAANEKAEPQMISTGGKNLQDLAISPNGKTLAFVEETADENIWELASNQTPRPVIRSSRADHSPNVSPDGTHLVFVSDRTGNYEIWLADADGKNQRQLTDSQGSAGSPRFSPDGKTIAFDAQNAGSSDVYTVSANGGAPVRLTENGKNNSLPAWSVDGQWIFFLSNRTGDDQIHKMPASGGEAAQITRQGAFEMFAAPDGSGIIYSKGGGKTGLWRVGIDGGDEKPLPELAEVGAWRSWTITADGIYYTAFTAQPPFHIELFDFTNRRTKELISVEKSPLAFYSNLSVSPDGRKIFYARQDQSAGAIMLAELNREREN